MIKFFTGNIFDSGAEALVNTVNTVGVMGKGVALQFKERFPENFLLYEKACKKGDVTIGKMFVTPTNLMVNPKWIINFPTKKHWLHPSSYGFIEAGLDDLIAQLHDKKIKSVSIPPLGSGQGGLDWNNVKSLIQSKLSELDIDVFVFEPSNLQVSKPVDSKAALLTKPRALVLALMDRYRRLGYDITLLEIQKMAYFLQRMGQTDLKLNYKKYHYGPYAHNLQHLLHQLERDFIIAEKTVLDSKPLDLIYLNTSRLPEVQQFIRNECSPEEKERLERIGEIIKGYESPFGLELLSSIDWIVKEENDMISNISAERIKEKVRAWSERKGSNFSLEQIKAALNRLVRFQHELSYSPVVV